MAYKITQHRRGTYEEWLSFGEAPLEGELIIVEFDNNVRKCKIGDGITYFSDLPYITDWVVAELEDQISSIQELTEKNLDIATADLYQKITDAVNEQARAFEVLKSNVCSQVDEIASEVNTLSESLAKVDGVVKTLVEPAVGALDTKYSEELSRLSEQHKIDCEVLSKTLEDKIGEVKTSINVTASQNSTESVIALNKAKAELTTDYTSKIAASEESIRKDINSAVEGIQRKLQTAADIQTTISDLSEELDERIDKKVAASEARSSTSVQEVLSNIRRLNVAVEQLQSERTKSSEVASPNKSMSYNAGTNISDVVKQLEDLQYSVAALEAGTSATKLDIQNINVELSRLATSFNSLSNQQKAGLNTLSTAITALEAKLSKADSDTNAAVTSYITSVNNEIAKLTSADNLLYQVIYKIQDTLVKKIEVSDAAIQAELTDDVAKINTDIANTKINLDNQLTKAQEDLAGNIAEAKAELVRKIDNLDKLHSAKLDANDSAIKSLNSIVTNSQTNLTGLVESMSADIVTNTANIASNSLAIGQVGADLDRKASVLNAGIEAVSAKVDSNVTNLESKLQTRIDAVDSAVQKHSEDILSVHDKVDDLIEELDTRIANKIIEGNAPISSSIVEIRESLKQIKLDLEKKDPSDSDSLASILANISKINDELVDLAADDVILYQIIYRVRDELIASISGANNTVLVDISAVNERLTAVEERVADNLSDAYDELADKINEAKAESKDRSNQLETLVFSKANTNAKSITELATTVKNNSTVVSEYVKELEANISNNKEKITANKLAINQVSSALNTNAKTVQADIDLLDSRLDAQEKRIGALAAFTPTDLYDPSKEYLAEAVAREVVDARLGHESVASAITATNDNIQELRSSLSQFIDSEAIDGLYYDVEGEVGLGVPYYLYLKAGDEIIQDSGVQIIGGAGGGQGGGASELKINYVTPKEVKVTPGAEAKIYFTFSGEDSSGDAISSASATWRVDGLVVERGTIYSGQNTFDATKYIKEGTIKLHLTVADDNGSSTTKTWEIQLIDLKVESEFFDKKYYAAGENILVDFVPTGAVAKYAKFVLDGDEKLIAPMFLDSTKSGTTEYCELPPMSHGAHLLEIYLEADINDTTIKSTTKVVKDIICISVSDKKPVIGTVMQELNVMQYSSTNIIYTVYDPSSDTPTVDIIIDGTTVSAGYTVEPNKDYGNTPTAIYTYVATTAGHHEIKIVCGESEKKISVYVEDLGLSITPVTAGLVFDFNPAGRTNGDANRLWSHNGVHMSVSDNFDWTNGGYLPNDPDGPCFCVKAGSTATIDYKLFGSEAKETGREFKLVFKTKNVASPDAIFLSCIDSKTSPSRVGIEMGVHNANIYGKSGNLELAYSEEDVIELEFNISKESSSDNALNMVMGYEDGVPSRPMIYDSTYSFKQQGTPKPITIGSPDCDIYIYRFKVYNTSLSNVNILNNFIADARTAEEMVNRYRRNQIYDENNKLTPESLAAKCPWLRVIKISAPKFTSSKKDDIPNSTIQQIYGQGRASDNWVAYNAVHSGQGTSSDNYGAAGRNIDLKIRVIEDKNGNPINSNPYFLLSDNSIVDKVSLTDTSIPVDYFNIKVNIASSNNLTNAIIANHYNEFNPYRRPFVEREGININHIKDTMEFHNCVVFIQETDPDLSTHREFADTDWHFYAIGNIGDSKKTDKTRVTDPDDKYECCVEIMDVGLPLSAFPRDTMTPGHFIDKDTGEVHITWSKAENLGILHEREYTLTTDEKLDFNKTYYIDVDGVKTNAMEYAIEDRRNYTWAKDENLGILYELSGYVQTGDIEVNSDKTYYIDVDGEKHVVTEDQLIGINPHDAGLFERVYELTEDTTVDYGKTYYVKLEEKDADGHVINEVFSDAMGYVTEQVKVYKYATQENLDAGLLYEVTYHKTTDTEVADPSVKTYYVDILENDDFSENYTYGWRYLAKKKDAEAVAACKQAWIDFYRFVTTSTDEEFKANLKDYFVVDSALYYYLFTTRYCMVDNRAKNTFWHYSKTADGTRKWDLCWDYDNDTSLGLNNYGKQVYRYGLEDTDYDASGEEVFRQSDSLFFCRIRDLFDEELKQMYQTLESRDAWTASSFINKCDEWQNEFPEDLWRIDIERKYIRTYSKSFINGKGDEQFLRDMANGRMKYHRRQWERNQEQYMASKYQTTAALGDAHHANFRVGRPSNDNLAVTPNYQFTLTPYSYIYLNVKYGGAAPISVRANPGVPTVVPYSTASADIINVGSAAAISDFGDLSAIYPRTASVQNATRIKKLKLGNNTEGYSNPIFQRLTTGSNGLLEELDITNVTSYIGAIDLKKLINLKKLLAFGTGISSASFADGGKLSYVELPAVNSIVLKRLKYLTSSNLKLTSKENVVDLVVEGCQSINQLELLESCVNVNRVRLDNVNFGTKTYDYFSTNIFKLKGLTATNTELDNAYIVGSVTIESLTGAQFNELRERYPNLNISYNSLESTIKFIDTDKATELVSEKYTRNTENKIDCIGLGIVPITVSEKVTGEEFPEFKYELFGWSTNPDEQAVNYEYLEADDAAIAEEADHMKYNENMLTNLAGDYTFYPVFKAIRCCYKAEFKVATNTGHRVLQESEIPYGSYAVYVGDEPTREDVSSSEAIRYSFVGWDPKPEMVPITRPTVFYAQFTEDELVLADIKYTVTGNTLAITECLNMLNDAIKIPDTFVVDGKECTVTSISGFAGYTGLKLITLPETLVKFGTNAFHECTSLQKVSIPRRVSELSQDAFSRCYELTKVDLLGNITVLGATCFSWCYKLADINLKEGLTEIRSYALNQCALTDVVIPSTVYTIGDTAFGDMNTLKTVTFKEYLQDDGNIRLPNIHARAFTGDTVTFNVPWTRDEHVAKYGESTFGAKVNFNEAFNFSYKEVNN